MFKTKTVLVLGAGASCDLGLPTGDVLKTRIASLLNIKFNRVSGDHSGDHRIVQSLRQVAAAPDGGGNINPYLAKAWTISEQLPHAAFSIDNFLDAHATDPVMQLCGKLAICKAILDAEDKSGLQSQTAGYDKFSGDRVKDCWYWLLLQKLTESVPKERVDDIFINLIIVSFNYDRCVERFLRQAISDYYNIPPEATDVAFSKLKIYHPYGKVGSLPWQSGPNIVPYGDHATGNLLAVSRTIKTFTEQIDDGALVPSVRYDLAQAETIVFLGFAFHEQNTRLIAPGIQTNVRRIFGTMLGVPGYTASLIRPAMEQMFMGGGGSRGFGITQHYLSNNCTEMFKEYWLGIGAAA